MSERTTEAMAATTRDVFMALAREGTRVVRITCSFCQRRIQGEHAWLRPGKDRVDVPRGATPLLEQVRRVRYQTTAFDTRFRLRSEGWARSANADRPSSARLETTPVRRSLPQHEVGVLVDRRRPAREDERAGVVILDDRGPLDHVPAQQLCAIEDHGLVKPAHLREPYVAVSLDGGRGGDSALGQWRATRLRRHAQRGEPNVHELHGILGRSVAVGALVARVELGAQALDVIRRHWA